MMCFFVIMGMAMRLSRVLVVVRVLSLFLIVLVMFVLTVRMIVLHRAMLMGFFFHGLSLSEV